MLKLIDAIYFVLALPLLMLYIAYLACYMIFLYPLDAYVLKHKWLFKEPTVRDLLGLTDVKPIFAGHPSPNPMRILENKTITWRKEQWPLGKKLVKTLK